MNLCLHVPLRGEHCTKKPKQDPKSTTKLKVLSQDILLDIQKNCISATYEINVNEKL